MSLSALLSTAEAKGKRQAPLSHEQLKKIVASKNNATANAFYFSWPPEDPSLKKTVLGLFTVVGKLWNLMWSFMWVKEPKTFFKHFKALFKLWFTLIQDLFSQLLTSIGLLEKELQGSKCATRSCR